MSLALARKYRPSTFNELIGQESVSKTLQLALERNKLSHAYLFSGLRGSGKTSSARIFAKSLLCETGITPNPCNRCLSCQMATESRHMDIIEMDGASNRKIENIRELIEHVKYKPAVGRFKIFIIDEVHMLTKEAFNALLKTLEEPPSFVKFILATTDPLKLPATILSRTQHFRFRKISQKMLVEHIKNILNLESVGYEDNAIKMIARSGAGSVRDSLTLLDQAIVYSKNFITTSTVTNMLGIIEPSLFEDLIDKILEKDRVGILEFVDMANQFETEMVIDELILYLKENLLNGSSQVPHLIMEKFFIILSESKRLLNIGSDGEFVLCLTFFKMMEVEENENKKKNLEKDNKKRKKETQKRNIIIPKKIIEDKGEKLFKNLIDKLYDRDSKLGDCFNRCIIYCSYENNLLTWKSSAKDEDKTLLKNNWGLIRLFAQEIFGYTVKIKNISKKLPPQKPITNRNIQSEEPIFTIKNEILNKSIKENSYEEKDILNEPMVARALELFSPKDVKVHRKK